MKAIFFKFCITHKSLQFEQKCLISNKLGEIISFSTVLAEGSRTPVLFGKQISVRFLVVFRTMWTRGYRKCAISGEVTFYTQESEVSFACNSWKKKSLLKTYHRVFCEKKRLAWCSQEGLHNDQLFWNFDQQRWFYLTYGKDHRTRLPWPVC